MSEFPGNSRKVRAEPEPAEKKIEKVVQGDVVRRRKPLGKRFSETFVGGDARSVWGYVAFDVLLPAAKDMVADAISQGVERMIFGETRSSGRRGYGRSGASQGSYVSYNRFAPGGPVGRASGRDEGRPMSRTSRATHDFDEIILATRVEAEEVIDRLFDLVGRYTTATVADLYELVGVTASHTDNKWGWTNLEGSKAMRVNNGYLLDLPKPEPVD